MIDYKAELFRQIYDFSSQKRISLHMPVHSGGALYDNALGNNMLKLDLTELDATDNLAAPSGAIQAMHESMARLFRADNAHILVGGSSSGIHAMLLSCVKRGGTVLVDRCAHISVINACIMYGITPVFIDREIDPEYMLPRALTPSALENTLAAHPNADAVLVTSPTYYGICSPIDELARISHNYGAVLIVDCAHGSHFAFSPALPMLPTELGADMCVLSLHKTLGAPTQTALLLHKSDTISFSDVKSCLNMVHTTSPSYMLMCAADTLCAKMASEGETLVKNMLDTAQYARELITKQTHCRCLYQNGGDLARLVINFSSYSTTGYEVSDILAKEYKIDVEMADLCNIVCITAPLTSRSEIEQLAAAITEITSRLTEAHTHRFAPVPPLIIEQSPHDAFFGEKELAEPDDCIGQICADTISVYPPGVPCLISGAKICPEAISCIKSALLSGGTVTGLHNGKIRITRHK